jgi:O-antigen ligase
MVYLLRAGALERYRFVLCLVFLVAMLELASSRAALFILTGLLVFLLVLWWRTRHFSRNERMFSNERVGGWVILLVATLLLLLLSGPVIVELRAMWPGGIGEAGSSVSRVLDISSVRATKTNMSRLLFWDKAWSMFLSAPWSGVGLGGFSWNFYNIDPRWITTPLYGTENNAHNVFMHLLAETGLPGVIWLLSLPIAVVVVLSRYAQRRKIAMAGAGAGEQGAGLSGADNAMIWIVLLLLAQALHSMVEFPLWHAFFLCLLAFVAGLLYPPAAKPVAHPARAVLTPTQRTAKWLNDERAGGGRLWPMVAVGFSAAAIALLVLHGKTFWDFHRVASISRGLQVDVVGASEVREMRRSLMVPFVDIGLALAIPLDGKGLPIKLSFSEKVVHYWPTAALVHRHIVLLAQAGRDGEALALLARVRKMVPGSELALRQLVEDLPAEALPGASSLRAALDSATQ